MGRGSCETIENRSCRGSACAGAPAPPGWPVRSARVFFCGFGDGRNRDWRNSVVLRLQNCEKRAPGTEARFSNIFLGVQAHVGRQVRSGIPLPPGSCVGPLNIKYRLSQLPGWVRRLTRRCSWNRRNLPQEIEDKFTHLFFEVVPHPPAGESKMRGSRRDASERSHRRRL